jgi:hypothetical protein
MRNYQSLLKSYVLGRGALYLFIGLIIPMVREVKHTRHYQFAMLYFSAFVASSNVFDFAGHLSDICCCCCSG